MRPINWDGLTKRFLNTGELEVLVALCKSVGGPSTNITFVEFGCHDGRTAKCLVREDKRITRYIGVEVGQDWKPAKAAQRGELPPVPGKLMLEDHIFKLIVKPRGSLDLKVEDLPQASVVFIDGDHSRNAVDHDTFLATAVIDTPGIIIWHDYHSLTDKQGKPLVDVADYLEELAVNADRNIQHVEGTWFAIERFAG